MKLLKMDKGLVDHLEHLGVSNVYVCSEDKQVLHYDKLYETSSLTKREIRFIIGAWNCSKAESI